MEIEMEMEMDARHSAVLSSPLEVCKMPLSARKRARCLTRLPDYQLVTPAYKTQRGAYDWMASSSQTTHMHSTLPRRLKRTWFTKHPGAN